MNESLHTLIGRFRDAQVLAVSTLSDRLGIPKPASNREWPFVANKHGINRRCKRDGIAIYSHGYGVELKFDGRTIDFDWGDNGEPDGFDAWRLTKFARDNGLELETDYHGVQIWLDDAELEGTLVKSGKLYFDPLRRANPSSIPNPSPNSLNNPMNVRTGNGL
jgi:hypothetical protein